MSYQVLSRKWRPQLFDEVIGQNHIIRTLQNAIGMDRVAHGYLFSGSRGIGKTTTARILAKVLSCENPLNNNPCNQCSNCKDITNGSSLDVQELDGASNRGIDEIRGLREAVKYPPSKSQYRIFIIDEVHMLTKEAFNALLKTLEEPPAHVIFIMATTDSYKVPATILSRTQKFDFKPISVDDITTYLKGILDHEEITYEEKGIYFIAKKARGSLRDSLSILDQVIAYANDTLDLEIVRDVLGIIEENVFLDVLKLINEKNHKELITYINKLLNEGFSISDFITGFNEFIRNCMLFKSENTETYNLSEGSMNWLNADCKFSTTDILRILDLSLKYESNLKYSLHPQISLEVLFMKLALLEKSIDIAQVLSGKNNLNISVKKPKSPTQPIALHNKSKDNKIDAPLEKSIAVKEPESNSRIENHTNLSLEKIQKSWGELINEFEKHNSKIAHFLEDVILSDFNGSQLLIELLNGHRFQKEALEKDIDQIESILNRILNENIKIKFHLKENTNEDLKEKKMEKEEHPLLDKVIETFEGEIIR